MQLFESPDFDDHEQVTFVCDPDQGLRGIISIHWGGPIGTAGGGIRMYPYASEDDALRDALRLSKAMSYKLALASLPGGGAKSVLMGDPRRDKTPDLLRAFGRAVEGLGGRYIAAEDVGTTPEDMEEIAKETDYVVGRVNDTSPATAHGVFVGLRAAVQHVMGQGDLEGVRVAIQGVGGVGRRLAKELAAAGAKLTVTDPNPEAVAAVQAELGARPVPLDEIYSAEVDVFAPCALGGILNDDTIPRLRATIVAGGANIQLAEDRHADALAQRGIFYAPDFVLNAGGVIAAAEEIRRFEEEAIDAAAQDQAARREVQRIGDMLRQVTTYAEQRSMTPHAAAVELAKQRIGRARGTE